MDMFDYNASAELFTGRLRMSRTQSVGYRRFARAVSGSLRYRRPARAISGRRFARGGRGSVQCRGDPAPL